MVKVGIIGCGAIARKRHAVEYKSNPNAQIAGFYDFSEPRAIEMAEEFGGKVYASAQEMIEDPAIDAVSVCAANKFHASLTIEALSKGKHVLCEKPMAITMKDCEEMLAAANKSGKRLLIDQNQRLTPAHQKAKEILASGQLGKILSFATTFGHKGPEMWSVDNSSNTWFFKKDTAAFGSMADLGIHKIDLMRFLAGDEVESVYSILSTLDKKFSDGTPIEVDDNSIEILRFRSGILGTVTTSWTHYGAECNATTLYCEKGIMRIYVDPQYSLDITMANGTKVHYELEAIQTNDDESQLSSGVIDLFVDSVMSGAPSILDANEVIKSMKVVFACLQSAQTGCAVSLLNR